MSNPSKGPEINVNLNENVSVKLNMDNVIQGAKDQIADAMAKSGKQLPSIPNLNLEESDDDSFDRNYEERKKDQRPLLGGNNNTGNNQPPGEIALANIKPNKEQSAPNPTLKKQKPEDQQPIVLAPLTDQQIKNMKDIPVGEPPGQTPMYTPYSQPGGVNNDQYNEDDDFYDDEIYQQMTMNQAKFYQLAYYQCYFDVKTMDVLLRLRKAIWPFCTKSQLFEDEDKVDLYGPIWIMITLIVEIAIVGFIDYQIDVATLAIELKGGKIASNLLTVYSLQKVARAGFVCIAYFVLNPLMLLLLIKYVLWVPDIQYLWLFAIYGYSFTIFIITTALNVVPIDWLKWVFLGTSGLVSLFFIFSEMYALIKYKLEQGFCKFLFVCLFLTCSHVIFIIALRKYFLT